MHVDVADRVHLREGEAGHVQPAAVVEVEHGGLVDHGLVVEARAALVAGHRHAAEDALLHGEHQLVGDALFPRHPADQLADPEAQVADVAATELQQRTPGDDLAHVQRGRRLGGHGLPHGTGVVGRILGDVGLPLVRIDVDVVDQGARHADVPHPQAASLREPLDLRDGDAAAVARRHGHREHLALERLALHGQVAVLVRGGAPDHGNVDREGVEQQPLAAAQRDHLHQVLGRTGVLLATGMARVHVRAEADRRHQAGPASRDLAHEL